MSKSLSAVFAIILGLSLSKAIADHIGRSLAPGGAQYGDVLILEGADSVDKRLLIEAAQEMRSLRAPRLVIVIHQDAKLATDNINSASKLEMQVHQLGLHDDQFTVLRTPRIHPITLTEASVVLKKLSEEGVRSAVLMTDGFHERRSYLVYKQVGTPLGISLTACPGFLEYTRDNWWMTSVGWREFLEEVTKTSYYYARGYLRLS